MDALIIVPGRFLLSLAHLRARLGRDWLFQANPPRLEEARPCAALSCCSSAMSSWCWWYWCARSRSWRSQGSGRARQGGVPRMADSFQCHTYLHAPGSVPQTSVCPHLDGSVAQLLRQLQHPRVVGNGLIEVPLRVVRAAQVAVGPRLLPPIL